MARRREVPKLLNSFKDAAPKSTREDSALRRDRSNFYALKNAVSARLFDVPNIEIPLIHKPSPCPCDQDGFLPMMDASRHRV